LRNTFFFPLKKAPAGNEGAQTGIHAEERVVCYKHLNMARLFRAFFMFSRGELKRCFNGGSGRSSRQGVPGAAFGAVFRLAGAGAIYATSIYDVDPYYSAAAVSRHVA